jgi:hypothetical protein
MRGGNYNAWTQKSLERLAALKPATYARTEVSSGFLGSLERYVYRPPPRTVQPAVPAAPAVAQAAVPAAAATAAAAAPGQADAMAAVEPAGAGNAVAR